MSEEKAKELGITPMATWVAGALGGVDPSIMGVGPVAATRKVMEKTGLTVADMDLIEANEAFASQSLAVAHDLEFDMSKVNVNGGAIALGHPVGASRRPHPGHAAVRHEAPRRQEGPGHPVHRRRHGLRHHRGDGLTLRCKEGNSRARRCLTLLFPPLDSPSTKFQPK